MNNSDITSSEFNAWQNEIRRGFYLNNFTANPRLFSEQDIADMPLLGNWSFNDFCIMTSQQAKDAKKDFLILKDKFVKQEERILNLESLVQKQSSIIHQQSTIIQSINSNFNLLNRNISSIVSSYSNNSSDNNSDTASSTNDSSISNTSSILLINTNLDNESTNGVLVSPESSPTNSENSNELIAEPPTKKVCY